MSCVEVHRCADLVTGCGQEFAASILLCPECRLQLLQGYLASRVAAFICEYLIEGHAAIRYVEGRHILLRIPIDASQGVYRDFDPYAVGVSLVRDKGSLKEFLDILCR
jgi:hypothetical protein